MTMTIPSDASQAPSAKGGSSRRIARQLALQLLFQQEFQVKNESLEAKFWENQAVSDSVRAFASSLLDGVKSHQADIDHIIQAYAIDWSIARMPVVDRNILRCAIYELVWEPAIPAAVTINEAIELSKRFADEEAQKFINGILDHILRREERLSKKRQPTVSEEIPPPKSAS